MVNMTNPRSCLTDDDLVRDLKEAWVLEIGAALNSGLLENWIALATRIGLKNAEIEKIRGAPNPGYEVLRHWRTGPNSTIRVLQNALKQMNRFDIVDRLEKAKTDPTDVTIVIRYSDQVWPLSEGGVPGRMTLLEYFRSHILCKFSQLPTKGKTCARLHLSPGSNLTWTSTVSEFRGQQIDIDLLPVERTQVRSAVELGRKQHVHVERNCRSCLEESLVFDVCSQESTSSPRRTSNASSSSSSSVFEFENLPAEDSRSVDSASSSHVLQCPSTVPAGNFSKLPGFHPEIPTDETRRSKAKEVLKDYLEKNINGAYILRRTAIENAVLVISVVYRREVLQFSILKNKADESYFIFTNNSFNSIPDLIAFYHHNSLSSDTMVVDTSRLFLTAPVS